MSKGGLSTATCTLFQRFSSVLSLRSRGAIRSLAAPSSRPPLPRRLLSALLGSLPPAWFNLLWRVSARSLAIRARGCLGIHGGRFFGSWVFAQMGRMQLAVRTHRTVRNLSPFHQRPYPPVFATAAAAKATPSRSIL